MSQFLYLYRGGANVKEPAPSPAAMQAVMERWTAWFKDLGAKGHLAAIGHPLDRAGKVVGHTKSDKTVTDGPFAEKDLVGGYSIIEAADLAQAAELSKGCPIFAAGGCVEVRPIMKM